MSAPRFEPGSFMTERERSKNWAIKISPLFDLLAFADNTFINRVGEDKGALISDMEKSLEAITKWMKQSGLKINEDKTEICLFSRHDVQPVRVKIHNELVTTSDTINVLGVLFDSKMQWSKHIHSAVTKSNRALNAIKLIRKYFNSKELVQLIISYFYSVLFYNSEIWHLNNLKQKDKPLMLATSSNALKIATHFKYPYISYYNLQQITKRATPEIYCNYKLSLNIKPLITECQTLNGSTWISNNVKANKVPCKQNNY